MVMAATVVMADMQDMAAWHPMYISMYRRSRSYGYVARYFRRKAVQVAREENVVLVAEAVWPDRGLSRDGQVRMDKPGNMAKKERQEDHGRLFRTVGATATIKVGGPVSVAMDGMDNVEWTTWHLRQKMRRQAP